MTDFDQRFKEAVAPIKFELDEIEAQITQKESELMALKASRTRGQKLLAILDPEAAQPQRKRKGDSSRIGEVSIEKILGDIRANLNGGRTFAAKDITELNGIHQTTVHKALKVLHERELIHLDHMGGARHTTKFYVLAGGENE